jgi:small ligand-binding sensory domain FIST
MARYAAGLSEHPVAASAVGEAVGQVLERLDAAPDLVCCFVTAAHTGQIQSITATVRELLGARTLVGCTAVSVAGGPQEVEERPGIALWAGCLGACRPVRLVAHGAGGTWTFGGIPDDVDRDVARTLVLLADPASVPIDALVDALARDWPALTVVGGLASASSSPGGNRLVLDDAVSVDGAVGVLLPPDVDARAVVSQGSRPVGDPFTVTRAQGNVLEELGGRPAMARLEHLVERASPEERTLLAGGVHLGTVIDETKEAFGRGDFLVRAILGAQRGTGAIVVGDDVRVGTTVQFHVRDAATADTDLRLALAGPPAQAALLFTCNARGVRLFGEPDHDALLVHEATGRGAVAGMFCAGEIGPVGLRTFVHGYTASVLLFAA